MLSKRLKKTLRVSSAAEMAALGAEFARDGIATPRGAHARVFALVGDLGAGKTTFTQGFLKQLGVRRRVISPTFLIMRPYKLPTNTYQLAVHIDCYRLHSPQELLVLGIQDILKNPENIVLIEWPELIKEHLPRDTRWIKIKHPKSGTHRVVTVS